MNLTPGLYDAVLELFSSSTRHRVFVLGDQCYNIDSQELIDTTGFAMSRCSGAQEFMVGGTPYRAHQDFRGSPVTFIAAKSRIGVYLHTEELHLVATVTPGRMIGCCDLTGMPTTNVECFLPYTAYATSTREPVYQPVGYIARTTYPNSGRSHLHVWLV